MQDGWGTLIPFIFPLRLLGLVKHFVITTQEWVINRSPKSTGQEIVVS